MSFPCQDEYNEPLRVEDVPGSDLDLNKLNTYRVDELKFWLSCRGDTLRNLPTKATCIQRINDYVKHGRTLEKLIDPTEEKIFLRAKVLKEKKSNDEPDQSTNSMNPWIQGNYWKSSVLKWSKSLLNVPTLTINEIENFFEKSGKTGKTQKRAQNLLFDNFLDSVWCCQDNGYFYVKGICSASYTKSQFHQLSCCLSSDSEIKYAYCTCKAGKGGFCNHVYALLKLVAQFVLSRLDNVPQQLPCTSRPCGWTVPQIRKMEMKKDTVMDTVIKKPRLEKPTKGVKCTLYEARSSGEQKCNNNVIKEMKENFDSKCIPLFKVVRNSVPSDAWCETKFGTLPQFSPLAYQCNLVGNNFKVYMNIGNTSPLSVPNNHNHENYPDFPHRYVPQYYAYDMSNVCQPQKELLERLSVTNEQAVALEKATRMQSQNALWFREREYRITASRVHDIVQWKRGMENHAEKYIQRDSLKDVPEVLKRKFEHGKMYESVALDKYRNCMKQKFEKSDVYPCGLVINTDNCWLGCSPDGKVVFQDSFGIAECKCPEQYKHCDIFDVASSNNNFMLAVQDNNLVLQKTHSTNYQIQCQLALTDAEFCDLIVYTFQSIAIIRVKFDDNFWSEVVSVLGSRYFKYILPKLITKI